MARRAGDSAPLLDGMQPRWAEALVLLSRRGVWPQGSDPLRSGMLFPVPALLRLKLREPAGDRDVAGSTQSAGYPGAAWWECEHDGAVPGEAQGDALANLRAAFLGAPRGRDGAAYWYSRESRSSLLRSAPPPASSHPTVSHRRACRGSRWLTAHGSTDVIRVVQGSEHNHGNEPRALLLAHLLECPEAVDAKHVEVQEDQARHIHGATLGRQQVVDDLHSVTSYNHLVGESLCLQKAYGKFGGRRIVLYQ
jgi:hypothetical protein